MKKDGLENVHLEPVKVPHWVRGQESAEIVAPMPHADGDARPRQQRRHAAGRHRSRGARRPQLRGARRRRRARQGPDRALQRAVHDLRRDGAVPRRPARRAPRRSARWRCWCARSGPPGLRTPHTGALRYVDGQPQIPAAAVTAEDAERLQRMQDRGTPARVRLKMEAQLPPRRRLRQRRRRDPRPRAARTRSWSSAATSTPGTSAPARPTTAAGASSTWEALRLMKKLNLRPRRTVRVVLWTNEENGLRGGQAYLRALPRPARQPRA